MRVGQTTFALLLVICGTTTLADADTSTVKAAGADFPYVEEGAGELVLFVHGALADHRAWAGVREDVAREHRFLAITQRHFGTGSWPDDKPYARDVHKADLVAILRAWNEPMHLVGWSYSGPIVLRAAIEAPELVRSVVIYEPTLESIVAGTAEGNAVVEEWYAGFADTAAAHEAGDNKEAVREAIEYVFGMPEGGFDELDEAQQTVLLENAHTIPLDFQAPMPEEMTCEELTRAEAPTLLIVGAETLPIFEFGAKAIAACMPNVEIVEIEGVGHGAPFQATEAFLEATLSFIGRQ